MTYRNRKSPMGYRDAIRWLLDNDDCDWIDDGHNADLSVSASLVADIFRRTDEEVRNDLKTTRSSGWPR